MRKGEIQKIRKLNKKRKRRGTEKGKEKKRSRKRRSKELRALIKKGDGMRKGK